MSPLLPVAVYALEVPPGEVMVPADIEFPAIVRVLRFPRAVPMQSDATIC